MLFTLASTLHRTGCCRASDATLGVIAQLVERLNGIEEVWGSNPHGSTKRFSLQRKGKGVVGTPWGFEPWFVCYAAISGNLSIRRESASPSPKAKGHPHGSTKRSLSRVVMGRSDRVS
jgi:hypothetical protein